MSGYHFHWILKVIDWHTFFRSVNSSWNTLRSGCRFIWTLGTNGLRATSQFVGSIFRTLVGAVRRFFGWASNETNRHATFRMIHSISVVHHLSRPDHACRWPSNATDLNTIFLLINAAFLLSELMGVHAILKAGTIDLLSVDPELRLL